MDRPRKPLLAGPRLTKDQEGCAAPDDAVDCVHKSLHRGAFGDEITKLRCGDGPTDRGCINKGLTLFQDCQKCFSQGLLGQIGLESSVTPGGDEFGLLLGGLVVRNGYYRRHGKQAGVDLDASFDSLFNGVLVHQQHIPALGKGTVPYILLAFQHIHGHVHVPKDVADVLPGGIVNG